MNIKETIYSLPMLWLVPFGSFLVGYLFAHYFFAVKTITVPRLVGLPISQGLKKLSDYKLNIRIIAEKEDLDLPTGTIISQKPIHPQQVKAQHAIFVVISKKPEQKKTPHLIGKNIEQAKKELSKLHLNYKIYTLPLPAPHNTVAAQYPAPNAPFVGHIYLYQATAPEHQYILPHLQKRELNDVLSFLERYNIKSTITYQNHSAKDQYIVVEQRPLPGTLISLRHPPHLQLRVQAL